MAFRIDPSQNPSRINVISRDDRILRGIYRFEGDQLERLTVGLRLQARSASE